MTVCESRPQNVAQTGHLWDTQPNIVVTADIWMRNNNFKAEHGCFLSHKAKPIHADTSYIVSP